MANRQSSYWMSYERMAEFADYADSILKIRQALTETGHAAQKPHPGICQTWNSALKKYRVVIKPTAENDLERRSSDCQRIRMRCWYLVAVSMRTDAI